jgi:hypothetical protein
MKRLTLLVLFAAGRAFGQAWLPEAGTTSVSLTLQATHFDAHTDRAGRMSHTIDMRPKVLTLSVDQALTNRLALSISVPYVETRFRGLRPHPSLVDDGQRHGALQDVSIDLRYGVVQGSLAVTPYLSMSWPTRNYPTLGHASPGHGLQEQEGGLTIGQEISALPGTWIAGSYAYTRVQKIDPDISTNRSAVNAEIGTLLTSRLSARVFGSDTRTHGGLTVPLSTFDMIMHFQHHDQLLRANSRRAGAGLSFSLTPAVDLHANFATVIRSANAHAGRSFAIGTSWTFDARGLLAQRRSRAPSL